jgi:hypothetical protein
MVVLKENTQNVRVGTNYGLDILGGRQGTESNGYEVCWKPLERTTGGHDASWGLLSVGKEKSGATGGGGLGYLYLEEMSE